MSAGVLWITHGLGVMQTEALVLVLMCVDCWTSCEICFSATKKTSISDAPLQQYERRQDKYYTKTKLSPMTYCYSFATIPSKTGKSRMFGKSPPKKPFTYNATLCFRLFDFAIRLLPTGSVGKHFHIDRRHRIRHVTLPSIFTDAFHRTVSEQKVCNWKMWGCQESGLFAPS